MLNFLKSSKFSLRHTKNLVNKLGPGLITGAADDDPSGIATYSQAGAQFGLNLLWTLALTTPLMIAIQTISARIGWITGQGLAASMCRILPRWLAISLVALLVFANTLNIAADIAAMGDALQLIIGGPTHGHAILFGLLCALLPVWLNYHTMTSILKWLTLALLSYVGVVLMLNIAWADVLLDSFVPHFQYNSHYWMMVVAILGTTISPYLFFWQASQEAEQRQQHQKASLNAHSKRFEQAHLTRIKLDTIIGMIFSNVIAFCVMLATAVTLNEQGITNIETTKQAAEALRPIAGEFAFTLFALGIIGTGMLAVPVLAGSAAYAVADIFHWRSGLDRTLTEAKGFYAVLIFATGVGTLVDFTALDPIKALIYSAVVNGVVAVPIMAVMMLIGSRRAILGDFTLSRFHQGLGWLATLVMIAPVIALIVTSVV